MKGGLLSSSFFLSPFFFLVKSSNPSHVITSVTIKQGRYGLPYLLDHTARMIIQEDPEKIHGLPSRAPIGRKEGRRWLSCLYIM